MADSLVAIIGRANVGKSTLFNRLIGERQAITHDTPGTTRDAVYGRASWGKHHFGLVDTAGLKVAESEIDSQLAEQIKAIASSADVLVVVADAATMVTDHDRQAAKLAHKTGKPVILALNKIDAGGHEAVNEFRRLGISTIVPVSSIHGTGTGDLLDAITANIKSRPAPKKEEGITIALLGRPNVGKSTLLNGLAGKQQAITSPAAGTTRDVNATVVKYHQKPIELLDTAGLRRSGKIEAGIEKFSTLRTIAAIAQADICVVVMDSTEPATAGDQHITGLVLEAGKGLILVMNKWDAVEKDDKTQARLTAKVKREFQFTPWAPLLYTSAATGLNLTKLYELAAEIQDRRLTKIPAHKINATIGALVAKKLPAGTERKHPKIHYATQTAVAPPTFTLLCTHPDNIHFSYQRYLENGLRAAYDLIGTPIKLEFRAKRKD